MEKVKTVVRCVSETRCEHFSRYAFASPVNGITGEATSTMCVVRFASGEFTPGKAYEVTVAEAAPGKEAG